MYTVVHIHNIVHKHEQQLVLLKITYIIIFIDFNNKDQIPKNI